MRKAKTWLSVSLMVVFLQPAQAMVMSEEGENTPIWKGMRLFREGNFEAAAALLGPHAGKAPIARLYCRELVTKGLLSEFPTDEFLDTHAEQRLADRWFLADDKFKKLMKMNEKRFSQALMDAEKDQSGNGAFFYLMGQLYETGSPPRIGVDKIKAAEFYGLAFENGETKGMLGLSRISDPQTQKISFLTLLKLLKIKGKLKLSSILDPQTQQISFLKLLKIKGMSELSRVLDVNQQKTVLLEEDDISLFYLKTIYACLREEKNEGDIFWKMVERLSHNTEKFQAKTNPRIYSCLVYAGALHGNPKAQCHYAEAPREVLDTSLFWARCAAEQNHLNGLRLSTTLLQEDKPPKYLEYLQKAANHENATSGDYFCLGLFYEENKEEQAQVWFQKTLGLCSEEEACRFGIKLSKLGLNNKALPLLEKGKKYIAPEDNMSYWLIFYLENSKTPISEEFSDLLHAEASKYNIKAIVALSHFMGAETATYDIEKLLKYTEGAYKATPENLQVKHLYAGSLSAARKNEEALDLFLSLPLSLSSVRLDLAKCYYRLAFSAKKDMEKARNWAREGLEIFFPYLKKTDVTEISTELTELILDMYELIEKAGFDKDKHLEHLQLFAEKGVPEALCDLGEAYEKGALEFKKDDQKAKDYYKRAYKKGIYKYNPALTYLLRLKMNQEKKEEFLSVRTREELDFLDPYLRAFESERAVNLGKPAILTTSDEESDDSVTFSQEEFENDTVSSDEEIPEASSFPFDEGLNRASPSLSDSSASQPSTPRKKSASPSPKEMEKIRVLEKVRRNSAHAVDAKKMLKNQKVVKRRQLNSAFNAFNRVAPVRVSAGKGSGTHVKMGDSKTAYHQPHGGAHARTVDRGALRLLARQFSEILEEKEKANK